MGCSCIQPEKQETKKKKFVDAMLLLEMLFSEDLLNLVWLFHQNDFTWGEKAFVRGLLQ